MGIRPNGTDGVGKRHALDAVRGGPVQPRGSDHPHPTGRGLPKGADVRRPLNPAELVALPDGEARRSTNPQASRPILHERTNLISRQSFGLRPVIGRKARAVKGGQSFRGPHPQRPVPRLFKGPDHVQRKPVLHGPRLRDVFGGPAVQIGGVGRRPGTLFPNSRAAEGHCARVGAPVVERGPAVGPRIGVSNADPRSRTKNEQKECLAHPAGKELPERRTNPTFPRHIQLALLMSEATQSALSPQNRHVVSRLWCFVSREMRRKKEAFSNAHKSKKGRSGLSYVVSGGTRRRGFAHSTICPTTACTGAAAAHCPRRAASTLRAVPRPGRWRVPQS